MVHDLRLAVAVDVLAEQWIDVEVVLEPAQRLPHQLHVFEPVVEVVCEHAAVVVGVGSDLELAVAVEVRDNDRAGIEHREAAVEVVVGETVADVARVGPLIHAAEYFAIGAANDGKRSVRIGPPTRAHADHLLLSVAHEVVHAFDRAQLPALHLPEGSAA